jgi:ribonuclease T2
MASSIPSLRSFSKFALGGAQVLLGSGRTVLGGTPLTCSNPQLSCHNTTVVENLCCFNAPGGQLLQTQFWDTAPATGPDDSWTLHGLWYVHHTMDVDDAVDVC